MQPVQAKIGQCNDTGDEIVVQIMVTIRNDGSVESAVAKGSWAGSVAGLCGAHLVCAARFPRFTNSRQVVLYPFTLGPAG